MTIRSKSRKNIYSKKLVLNALYDSILKLNPLYLVSNPVIFSVELGSIVTTLYLFNAILQNNPNDIFFIGNICIWLWLTVLFSNIAESLAEGRGKAQASNLRQLRKETTAKKIIHFESLQNNQPVDGTDFIEFKSTDLLKGDIIFVEKGDIIPLDGDAIKGVASVDESAITGESAPVIRESGGDRSAVTGGTKIISDWLIIRVTSEPGSNFIDKMISLVEGAKRKKTPNEIALGIFLISLTFIFFIVCFSLLPVTQYSTSVIKKHNSVTIVLLVALFVCLAPTTIGGLLSAIGIAGMDRLIQKNVIAMSGRAIEAAGDIDNLLLDKTGTITLGNRYATEFIPIGTGSKDSLIEYAYYSSFADETPEGRSIIILAKNLLKTMEPSHRLFEESYISNLKEKMKFIPFTAYTKMSGVDFDGNSIRKGSADTIYTYIVKNGKKIPLDLRTQVEKIAEDGGTPLIVTYNFEPIGVIHLKDIIKESIKERFKELRIMGIKSIMITGDNKLTAAAIAAEAGLDDFLAEATPESKLNLIKKYQQNGAMVAMTGDGTNDAPALAQADVAVAMNTGTQAAREAANIIDLDNNPTKIIEIVSIGKQLLMTRGALTTFSISNDISKYFTILQVIFAMIYPPLAILNFLQLNQAILSTLIFNALVILLLVPLALKGVSYKPMPSEKLLKNNLVIYGIGGAIFPFIAIKFIDIILTNILVIH